MRLLVFGNVSATGFGTVSADLGSALIAQGHDVRFYSWNPVDGDLPEPFANRTAHVHVGSAWASKMAAKATLEHLHEGALFPDAWAPEVALILGDVASMLEERVLDWFPAALPAFHYAPVEGTALPPAWGRWWSRFTPIAMSEFGAAELEAITGKRPPVIYHGVDPAFHPVSPARPITWRSGKTMMVIRSKADAKKLLGIPNDAVFIFRADANVVRKAYFEFFGAMAGVVAADQNVIVGVHCRTRDYGGDLDDMLSHFPPVLRERMGQLAVSRKFADAGAPMPREVLAVAYNAADIYVTNACEGFGLTIAEAMACGTPVVGMDWSAVPEVVGKAGILVPPGRMYPNNYAHFWAVADDEKLAAAVTTLVHSRSLRRRLGDLGPIRVGAMFQWPQKAREFVEAMSPAARIEVAA